MAALRSYLNGSLLGGSSEHIKLPLNGSSCEPIYRTVSNKFERNNFEKQLTLLYMHGSLVFAVLQLRHGESSDALVHLIFRLRQRSHYSVVSMQKVVSWLRSLLQSAFCVAERALSHSNQASCSQEATQSKFGLQARASCRLRGCGDHGD